MSLPLSDSPAIAHPLPTWLPLPHYAAETCLDTITSLPVFSLRPEPSKYRFPGLVAPFDLYLSHLPPDRLGLDRASQDGLARAKDSAITHPDDPDIDRILYMGIELDAIDLGPRPAVGERRWSLLWTLPAKKVADNASVRLLALDPSGPRPDNYYINYGPITRVDYVVTAFSGSEMCIRVDGVAFIRVSDKKLTFAQRQELEGIAWNIGVLDRQADYGPHNWVVCLMSVAMARGVLDEDDVRRTLTEAVKTNSPGKP